MCICFGAGGGLRARRERRRRVGRRTLSGCIEGFMNAFRCWVLLNESRTFCRYADIVHLAWKLRSASGPRKVKEVDDDDIGLAQPLSHQSTTKR